MPELKFQRQAIDFKPTEFEIKQFIKCMITHGDPYSLHINSDQALGLDVQAINRTINQLQYVSTTLHLVDGLQSAKQLDFTNALKFLLSPVTWYITNAKCVMQSELARTITQPAMQAISGLNQIYCTQYFGRILDEIVGAVRLGINQYVENIFAQAKLDESIYKSMNKWLTTSLKKSTVKQAIIALDEVILILRDVLQMESFIESGQWLDKTIDVVYTKVKASTSRPKSPKKQDLLLPELPSGIQIV